jgi:hypothetical protein
MKRLDLSRDALCSCVAAAILAACGGSPSAAVPQGGIQAESRMANRSSDGLVGGVNP